MPDEATNLLARLRAGDSQAAVLVHDRYVERLVALARSRLSQKLARRIDAEDVVQSVYRSFFAHAGEDRYVLERAGDLWRLLSAITINKVLGQVEHHRAKKRSIEREQSLAAAENGDSEPFLVATEDPLPEQAVMLVEELEAVMQVLDPAARRALELRLQGMPVEQIARECDCSERSARRFLERARKLIEARLLESSK
jgi:RNA polymerase sigma-70 factor (ECF subfamily)